jgi:hypothetical protein
MMRPWRCLNSLVRILEDWTSCDKTSEGYRRQLLYRREKLKFKMFKTDYHADSLGNRDYVFSCHNRAFVATWSPLLPQASETLIDLELTEFLDIPIKKIEA